MIQIGFGAPESVLRPAEVPTPGYGPSDVLVRVVSAAVNTPDWLLVRWIVAYGAERAQAIATMHAAEPTLDLSVKSDPAGWAQRLDGIAAARRKACGAPDGFPVVLLMDGHTTHIKVKAVKEGTTTTHMQLLHNIIPLYTNPNRSHTQNVGDVTVNKILRTFLAEAHRIVDRMAARRRGEGGAAPAATAAAASEAVARDVLDATAICGGERLHAAVRIEAPGPRGQGTLSGDLGELARGVVLERLDIEGDGGVRASVAVGERSAGVREQVAVVAVAPGLRGALDRVADQAAKVVVDERLGEIEALGGEVVARLGELAGGVVTVCEVEEGV